MLTSLLKGLLFVLVMAGYSICVWRTVNQYFGKEFKTYIQLDPDVRQDKALQSLLAHPAPDPTSQPVAIEMAPGTGEPNDYNEVAVAYAKDDFSITVKSIKLPSSSSETEATTNKHSPTDDELPSTAPSGGAVQPSRRRDADWHAKVADVVSHNMDGNQNEIIANREMTRKVISNGDHRIVAHDANEV